MTNNYNTNIPQIFDIKKSGANYFQIISQIYLNHLIDQGIH